MPALRRPCTPRLTEAASRSASTISGGRPARKRLRFMLRCRCRHASKKLPAQPVDHVLTVMPFGARGEVQRHAMAQHRLRQRHDIVGGGASRPSSSARARTASMKAWLARGPGPQAIEVADVLQRRPSSGRAARTRRRIASTTFSPTGMRRTTVCASIRSSGVQTRAGAASSPKVVASSMRRSASLSG